MGRGYRSRERNTLSSPSRVSRISTFSDATGKQEGDSLGDSDPERKGPYPNRSKK
jgi:hypothetical protein